VVSHLAQGSQVSFQTHIILAKANLSFSFPIEDHFFQQGLLMSFDRKLGMPVPTASLKFEGQKKEQ
jgi:hypothetical protein